ncbi:hypothetical protein ACE1CI_03295 [Aerosakkonemataceae cyanobacterium BLCC-F50]|uniref:Uncharacterized protein n=1 Tax=Floridaenema flaviceps BLCC-F50 TaxID=3153642 RepID=A0ABV4XJS7_9CYAN
MTLSLIIESPGISLQEIADSLADVFGKCQAESDVSSTIKVLKNKGFVVSCLQQINNRNRRLYYPSASMKQQRKVITSHIHSRIANLSQKALQHGLIEQCDRTSSDTYLLRLPNQLTPTEYNTVSTGVVLLQLLKQLEAQ